ncbi:Uncharacterised protein [Slackia heliotrinireducens]|nr:hypothetical protein [Slackia heliotrinireducens]VEH00218.1 Uncharacterised protein [Slackia heliotrinireducens]
MKKRIALFLLTVSAALLTCMFGCGPSWQEELGWPTYGQLESVAVQEYANGEAVSREISYDLSDWDSYESDEYFYGAWGGVNPEFEPAEDNAPSPDSTQAIRCRITTVEGSDLEFYIYNAGLGASYIQMADGSVWRCRSEYPEELFEHAYSRYQHASFDQAFKAQVETGSFEMLPEYNGTGKAVVIEDERPVADDPDDPSMVRVKPEDVYWEGWDGTGSLQLPHYQGYWKEEDYGALRAEDVRFVVVYATVDSQIDGHWVDEAGNHVSNSYSYTYEGTVYDLATDETATFGDRGDASIFDQVREFIDEANAQG